MIQVDCIRCGDELEDPGAIILGPPVGWHVQKFHVCLKCWPEVVAAIEDTDAVRAIDGTVDIESMVYLAGGQLVSPLTDEDGNYYEGTNE